MAFSHPTTLLIQPQNDCTINQGPESIFGLSQEQQSQHQEQSIESVIISSIGSSRHTKEDAAVRADTGFLLGLAVPSLLPVPLSGWGELQ